MIVLAVDDNALTRRAYRRVCESVGWGFLEAEGVEEAMVLLSGRALLLGTPGVDVVLTDYVMEGLDGIAMFERIRERWASLPVVVATGALDDRVRSAGFSVILEKPIGAARLVRALIDAAGPAHGEDEDR